MGRVTLTLGEEEVLRYYGRIRHSKALIRAIAKVAPEQDPVQSWAGLTKRRKR